MTDTQGQVKPPAPIISWKYDTWIEDNKLDRAEVFQVPYTQGHKWEAHVNIKGKSVDHDTFDTQQEAITWATKTLNSELRKKNSMNPEDIHEVVNSWTEVGTAGIADWEWDTLAVWYDPQARVFYWKAEGGCSCNSFLDDVTSISEFNVGSFQEAYSAAKKYVAGRTDDDGYFYGSDLPTKIREFKVKNNAD